MTADILDFAIIGSTPMARLLAGELAATHGKRVVLVGHNHSSFRLPHGLDLSVAPITRPESWVLLTEGTAEVLKRLARIGARQAIHRVDPLFLAQSVSAIEALSHVRHMALGFGLAAEIASKPLATNSAGIVIRDAARLHRPALDPALHRWFEKLGVSVVSNGRVNLASDGSASFEHDGKQMEARQTILADDEAVLGHIAQEKWPELLRRIRRTSVLTMPTQPLAAPLIQDVQSGITLLQQPQGGIIGIGPGETDTFPDTLRIALDRPNPLPQAGQTSFTAIATTDGAPAFGRLDKDGPHIVAGLDQIGAFLAPSIARWLCGTAKPHEMDWYDNRLVTRPAIGNAVGDFASGRRSEAA